MHFMQLIYYNLTIALQCMNVLRTYIKQFAAEFADEAEASAVLKEFEEDTEIVKLGQYIKYIPLILSGTVKVFTRQEDKDLLLYYIDNGESCIMSFNAGLNNTQSRVFAIAEKGTQLALFSVEEVKKWMKQSPGINFFFYNLYNQRYASLLDTINHLLYSRLDQRLYAYLLETARQRNSKAIHITHKQIAAELGTAREVVSRIIKKLELDGKVKQLPNSIEIL